jgi:hypothetical protein
MLQGFLDTAEQDALNLARQRAADLLGDVQHQVDEARRLLYAPEADAALASALAINAPKAAELLDVSGLTILANRLRANYAAFGGGRPTPGKAPPQVCGWEDL